MGNTTIELVDGTFRINQRSTYTAEAGFPNAHPLLSGKLLMLKTANCLFDDQNYPYCGSRQHPYWGEVSWDYPDGPWDAARHTREFIDSLALYARCGFNMVSATLMQNVPTGRPHDYPWDCCAYDRDGSLKSSFSSRLDSVLQATDRLGLIVFLVLFCPRGDHHLPVLGSEDADDELVRTCVGSVIRHLIDGNHTNVILEVVHEPDNVYSHRLCTGDYVHEFIHYARAISDGRFLLTAGYWNPSAPSARVLASVDFLSHGEQNASPSIVRRDSESFRHTIERFGLKTLLFCQEVSGAACIEPALETNTGVALYNQGVNDYNEGYQSVPVNWRPTTPAKWNLCRQVAHLTGSLPPGPCPPHTSKVPACVVTGLPVGAAVYDWSVIDLRVHAPYYHPLSEEYRLNRVEYLIDDILAASCGYVDTDDTIDDSILQLNGSAFY